MRDFPFLIKVLYLSADLRPAQFSVLSISKVDKLISISLLYHKSIYDGKY